MLVKRQHSLGSPPSWSLRIAALRNKLGYTQAAFAERLNYSAMAVSRWERGSHEPTASTYIRMGNLAGPPDCWFFWQKSGLAITDVVRSMPPAAELHRPQPLTVVAAGIHKRRRLPPTDLVALPVLSLPALPDSGARNTSFENALVVSMLAAPKTWCPNPEQTRCLQIKGTSMSPLIRDGDVVAIDTSETDVTGLRDKIIVVSHVERGFVIATLRRFHNVDVLEPASKEFESFPLERDRSWRILGKVLWWLARAP